MAYGYNINQRKINKRNHIIDIFRENGALSKVRAKELSGYSMDTIISVFNSLIDEKILIPAEGEQKAKGRKAAFFTLNSKKRLYLGITFNQSGIYSSIMSFSHEILENISTPLKLGISKDEFLDAFTGHLKQVFNANPDLPGALSSIGCSIPGDIDLKTGILHTYVFMPFLKELNFREILNSLSPHVPVTIDHNIRSMSSYLLTDMKILEKYKRILFISARSGTANSLIYKGEIVTEHGELGHIRVSDNNVQCPCGRYGCLDCYFSYHSFMELLSNIQGIEQMGGNGQGNDYPGLDILREMYSRKVPAVVDFLEERISFFSKALLDGINITAPDLVLLSGDLFRIYGDPVNRIKTTVSSMFPSTGAITHFANTEIQFIDLGTEIASFGVCYDMIRNDFSYYQEDPVGNGLY